MRARLTGKRSGDRAVPLGRLAPWGCVLVLLASPPALGVGDGITPEANARVDFKGEVGLPEPMSFALIGRDQERGELALNKQGEPIQSVEDLLPLGWMSSSAFSLAYSRPGRPPLPRPASSAAAPPGWRSLTATAQSLLFAGQRSPGPFPSGGVVMIRMETLRYIFTLPAESAQQRTQRRGGGCPLAGRDRGRGDSPSGGIRKWPVLLGVTRKRIG